LHLKELLQDILDKLLKDATQPFAQFCINGSGDGFFVGWDLGSISG